VLEISQNLRRVPENAGYLASMFFARLPIFIVREIENRLIVLNTRLTQSEWPDWGTVGLSGG